MKSVEHASFTLTSRDGFPLAGHSWIPPHPKAMVAVIHGLGEHSGRYARFARAAAAQNIGVVAIDLRGHGASFGERTYVDRFSDYLLDADALMGLARKLAKGLPLFLMGHSMGGAVAMRWVAERQPDLVGLILSSAALKIGNDVSKLLINLAPIISRFAPHLRVKKVEPDLISRDKAEIEAYRKDPLVCHLPTPARTGAELLWAIESNRAAARVQTLPLYLFHGDADLLTDPNGSRELYTLWGCPDKTLRIWPRSRHEALNDLDRDAVMEELFAWVDAKVDEKKSADKRGEERLAAAKVTAKATKATKTTVTATKAPARRKKAAGKAAATTTAPSSAPSAPAQDDAP
ncbi:MAG: alpha/beta hydrolase [Rhodoferax sp.]|nr:alpha/beta hydrolase [Rhodoferax sp.]